jgi:hypothetical protein
MHAERLTFTGHIASFGTRLGVRIVIGCWAESPFGGFTDVMLQTADDERVLLAPDPEVADFVSSTYQFDRVEVGPVRAWLTSGTLDLSAAQLDVVVGIGGPASIDRLLRLVPGWLASSPWWLRAIDPLASRIVPGVHTAGTAGNGRREYYGVRRSRKITMITGKLHDADLGGLAPLHPPVQFGFASAPTTPQIVAVTTHIDVVGR